MWPAMEMGDGDYDDQLSVDSVDDGVGKSSYQTPPDPVVYLS